MSATRDSFRTKFGFILASAGAAIGLGNIWGFPTQAANNGGGAFLLVYILVTFILALPALYAEVYIGNHFQKNPVSALRDACQDNFANLGKFMGILGLIGAVLMLSFYTIVAGWMLANALSPLMSLIGLTEISKWLALDSMLRNIIFTPIFILLTALIIFQGVNKGIEKWSGRLMPLLLFMLLGLIIYILQQPGALEGVYVYLIPDFSKITEPSLIISAMGQAFFSLAIGVGSMMIYGSYIKKSQGIGQLVISITLLDTFIAFIAGLLIIPALYVAHKGGLQVFDGQNLIGEGQLIFNILPQLFQTFGFTGLIISSIFFLLLSIAALTSTISAVEVPVSYLVEDKNISRIKATNLVSLIVFFASLLIILFFDALFSLVISLLTTVIQPISCLFYFIVIGWLWRRGNQLHQLSNKQATLTLKLWSHYLRFICPILLIVVFVNIVLIN